MHSPSIWPGNDAVPESIADEVHAIPACVRRHPPTRIAIVRVDPQQEARDRAIADVRAGLVAAGLHAEQVARVMGEVEAMAAEVGL